MESPAPLLSPTVVRQLQRGSRLGGVAVTVISQAVLAGWALDSPVLTSIYPAWTSMKPNTAICLMALGVALLLFGPLQRLGAVRALGAATTVVALASLSQDLFGWNLGIDQLFFADAASSSRPGRMAPTAAILLMLLGLSTIRLDAVSLARRSSQSLAALASAVALMTLSGYVYGVDALYTIPGFGSVSAYTAACVLVVGVSLLAAQPRGGLMIVFSADTAGSALARQILPVFILVPTTIGLLSLLGQRRGFYDTPVGLALFTVANTAALGSVAWFTARRLIDAEVLRRTTHEDLVRSQELLQAISDNSSAVIYAKALDGRYLFINQRFADLFHVTVDGMLGKTDYDLFSRKEEADVFREMDQRVAAAGVPQTAEEPVPLDGVIHTYLSLKCPLRDEHGQVYAVFGISTDITDRKRAEELLRANEERTRLIIESALDAVVTIDAAGIITGWSPQAERIFGWDRDEAVGRVLAATIVPERYREAHRSGLARFIRTGEGAVIGRRIELAALHRDGHEFPIELSITAIQSGTSVAFSAFVRDITERTRADERLRTQVERLNLLDQVTRAIGERQDIHSVFQVVLRSLEEQLPLDLACVCLLDGADQTLVVTKVGAASEALAETLSLTEGTKLPIDGNGLARCIGGHLVHEADTLDNPFPFPQRLSQGGVRSLVVAPLAVESSVFGVLVSGRSQPGAFSSADCEFLRQLSQHVALAAQHAQLYSALQHAYDDLRRTQEAVVEQERLRALGQMASGIAHDINNAISPLALYVELLLEAEPGIGRESRENLLAMQHAIDDVAHTVAGLREFYRERDAPGPMAEVNLADLMKEVVNLTRARWSDMPMQRGVTIDVTITVAADTPAIRGVTSELRQALINLVFNAVDAMPQGGTLALRARPVRTDSSNGPPEIVAVEVSDSGSGMDADTRSRCLEPFFTTKGERGTGLGLAMVYGVARRHSADIEIDSEPGRGTTVRLLFAVASDLSEEPSAPFQRPTLPPQRVLVVDDDPMLLRSLRRALENDGHLVSTADGGQAGIDTFRDARRDGGRFDAVITDLGMPYVDGRRVATAIKALDPATPVIMLTGWGQRMLDDGDLPPHVDRLLSKPPKLADVRVALAELIARRRE